MNTADAAAILGEVYESCKDLYPPGIHDAFLYGSFARGDYHSESDVDILLTVDMDREEIASRRSAVSSETSRLSLEYDVTVSVIVKPLKEFQQHSHILPFYQNVLREGIRYDPQSA